MQPKITAWCNLCSLLANSAAACPVTGAISRLSNSQAAKHQHCKTLTREAKDCSCRAVARSFDRP